MSYLAHANRQLENILKHTNLNAVVSLYDRASILSAASVAEQRAPQSAHPRSPYGRIVLVKDNICTTATPTTAASGILKNFKSPYDATVVKQLEAAGALVAGKTNMDEFGMGSYGLNSYHGPTTMSRIKGEERSAGGSSGGSALAVATDQCWAALGTDTGGSVRLPAAYTGVVGFKPSYGLLSRWGVIAYANSLDTVGVLGGDVDCVEGVFDALNVYDPQDPTSLLPSTRSHFGSIRARNSPLRIGIPLDYNISTLDLTVRTAWRQSLQRLQERGHTLHTVRLPATRHALSAYYVLAPAEASSNLAKYDGVRYGNRAEGVDGTPESVLFAKTRGAGFGPEVQRRILLGAFSLSAQAIDNYFIQAQKVRRLVQQDFDSVFKAPNQLVAKSLEENDNGVDVLLCPTAPTLAPFLNDAKRQDPIQAYMNDIFTVPASLAGLPAISVPISVAEEDRDRELKNRDVVESAGMQIIGQYGDDKLVLDVARELVEAASSPDKLA
ncbi:glutamyl-tRNA amidotransferas-like protein [Massarina eburnea CBS 473.64]|uniref:Glutamyl-tRNA(Gln) amidotransferase subunit A, mitochondrial n=1 Tax=Massarina eburnea CBS 473.64 TaxID=1395130 RepID=A0A6A6SD27_9PLEO|nr:glutamyl-tRNA amidotransferas-like protein [Massarina eburnea CBS 473.64]